MITPYSNIISVQTSCLDPNAQAFITAAGITDATQQQAINTLVVDMKGYGIWTKMKAIYPFVGGTASTHKWNLKDPRDLDAAFRLSFNGGWTHSNTGAKPNGNNAYADTFLIPTSSSESAYGVYTTEQLDVGIRVIICQQSNPFNYISPSLGILGVRGSGFSLPTTTKGMMIGFDIDTSNTYYTNVNGTPATANRTFNNFNQNSYFIGGFNSIVYFTSNNIAFAFIGQLSNQTEASNFYTAVQSFQTTLGRQV